MNEVVWEQADAPADADVAVVDGGLEVSNRYAADLASVRPLACFARFTSGKLIGGAIARSWGECCELRQLWVAPQHRRRGIARRLIDMVEQEALRRGCTLMYLETFSFQAPQLYQSIGFTIACEFRGFPDGAIKYVFRKDIAKR